MRRLLLTAALLALPARAHASDPADPLFRTVVFQGCVANLACQEMTVLFGTSLNSSGTPITGIVRADLVTQWLAPEPSAWELYNFTFTGVYDCNFGFANGMPVYGVPGNSTSVVCQTPDWNPDAPLAMNYRAAPNPEASFTTFTMTPVTTTPEPATLLLLAPALLLVVGLHRRLH